MYRAACIATVAVTVVGTDAAEGSRDIKTAASTERLNHSSAVLAVARSMLNVYLKHYEQQCYASINMVREIVHAVDGRLEEAKPTDRKVLKRSYV